MLNLALGQMVRVKLFHSQQGENPSPLLFAIYLNDFESYVSRHYNGYSIG